MKTFDVEVTMLVRVSLDETKFDSDFCDQFNNFISDFGQPDDPYMLIEHAENLAQLEARGMPTDGFIEGYGEAKNMGIRVSDAKILDMTTTKLETVS